MTGMRTFKVETTLKPLNLGFLNYIDYKKNLTMR